MVVGSKVEICSVDHDCVPSSSGLLDANRCVTPAARRSMIYLYLSAFFHTEPKFALTQEPNEQPLCLGVLNVWMLPARRAARPTWTSSPSSQASLIRYRNAQTPTRHRADRWRRHRGRLIRILVTGMRWIWSRWISAAELLRRCQGHPFWQPSGFDLWDGVSHVRTLCGRLQPLRLRGGAH